MHYSALRCLSYRNLRCPIISCVIAQYNIKKTLPDLGNNVNLLSSSVYKQLGIEELKPTSVIVQLVDGQKGILKAPLKMF